MSVTVVELNRILIIALAILLGMAGSPTQARVLSHTITQRLDLPASPQWPAYERLEGEFLFGLDPMLAANRAIVDLDRAPRNTQGLVEARANFMILRPKQPGEHSVALLEVSNRGGKAGLRYFNAATRSTLDPRTIDHFGDGLMMRLGLTVVWVGWQFDVPRDDPRRLSLDVPAALNDTEPIQGLVRADWVVDESVDQLALGHRNHWAYPPADPADPRNVLTRRSGRESPREVIPRDQWRFATGQAPDRLAGAAQIEKDGGFEPGSIYELVYLAQDPRLVGMGLGAVRDTMAWLRHEAPDYLRVDHGLAFGVSQTGRFLRHFLYQRFNVDEQGRRVFDGMLIHTAGAGRGSFNHRFGQPSRDAHRYSAFFYPTDLFPFTSAAQTDALMGRTDGLLSRYENPENLPRILVTNTGYEYWGRAAALLHVSADGTADVPPLDNERIYHLASAQHFVGRWPPNPDRAIANLGWQGNPLDFLVNLRALLSRLVDWVAEDRPPPPSHYPRLADQSLVPFQRWAAPDVAGLQAPRFPHTAYRANYGDQWSAGEVSFQPPRLGREFPALVPALDAWGNELGGVRNVEIRVPVATYLPWSLRAGRANPSEMDDFRGTLIPLERCTLDDDARSPVSWEESEYLAAVEQAANELIHDGFLLEEDRDRVSLRARQLYDWWRDQPSRCSP